jgi:hypothetical protein
MGILKTKGLRPLVQNRFPFATKMPIRNIPFSKIRGILELNQTKVRTDTQTDGRIITEVRALPLGKWERTVLPVYGPLVSYDVPDGDKSDRNNPTNQWSARSSVVRLP